MSVVAMANGTDSSVTKDVLDDVAARNGFKLSHADRDAYLLLLQSADATQISVDQLPDYVDPHLKPVPVVGGERKYWKEEHDPLNAWSHRTELVAEAPTSNALKGRTIAVKDNMSVAGLPLTVGTFPQLASPSREYPISPIDAVIVSRVLEAGAIVKGTSTCENYSCSPLSYTSASGPVSNPWLRTHATGGSTSGGACLLSLDAAIKAGAANSADGVETVDLALGGDQGGSIRIPAAFVGVYGLKPTHGLVPYTGIGSLHPMIDHCGPMAKNLQDIARLLAVIAGYDGFDPRMTPESPLRHNVPDYASLLSTFISTSSGKRLGHGLRVGILTESFEIPTISLSLSKVVSSVAKRHFTAAGATVLPISIPIHLLGPAIWTAATRGAMARLAVQCLPPDLLTHTLPQWTPRWPPNQEMYDLLTYSNPAIINLILWATFAEEKYPASVTAKAHRHVLELRAAYDKALEEVDVLITPTAPCVAPRHPNMTRGKDGGVLDKLQRAVGVMGNTCPFNASGHPALSSPGGWAEYEGEDKVEGEKGKKLPVGMQIIGRRFDEMMVLKAAAAFEAGGGGLGEYER